MKTSLIELSLIATLGLIVGSVAIALVVRVVKSKVFCWFLLGHDKDHVNLIVRNLDAACPHGYHTANCCKLRLQYARWVCRRCPTMGEYLVPKGVWKIQDGRLVPDRETFGRLR